MFFCVELSWFCEQSGLEMKNPRLPTWREFSGCKKVMHYLVAIVDLQWAPRVTPMEEINLLFLINSFNELYYTYSNFKK